MEAENVGHNVKQGIRSCEKYMKLYLCHIYIYIIDITTACEC